jgi:Tol biopolymer transport system component
MKKSIRLFGFLCAVCAALSCSLLSAEPQAIAVKTAAGGKPAEPTAAKEFRPADLPGLKDMGRIAFTSIRENGLSDIYIMEADGGNMHFLDMPESTDLGARWSPDGEWLAFLSSDGKATFDVMRVRPDGTDLSNLTDSTSDESGFGWSPDGSQIVFSSNRSGNYELYLMNADGSNVRQLTETPDADEAEPAWSPDGTTIGCLCGPKGEYTGDVCTVKTDGSDLVNLTPEDPDVDDFIWSPDGAQIAFGMPLFPEEIWRMDSGGSGKENLSENPADDGGIAFSPDGARIVFSSDRDGKTKQIYLLRLADRSVTALTDNDRVNVSPAWSPDGTWIAFVQAASLGDFDFEICAVRIDGRGLTNLTNNPGKDYDPDWEPLS